MNTLQKLGALFFEEQYSVPVRLNGNLAISKAGAPAGGASVAAGVLVAALERMCQQRVVQALADPAHGVRPSQVALEHRSPALPGAQLYVRAWVQRVGWDVVSFELEVRDRFKLVCEGTLTLALSRAGAAARPAMVSPLARRPVAHRPHALLGFLNPAMAGRALPVFLSTLASGLLFAIMLNALGPVRAQQAAQATHEHEDAMYAPKFADAGTQPPLALPASGPAQPLDAQRSGAAYGA